MANSSPRNPKGPPSKTPGTPPFGLTIWYAVAATILLILAQVYLFSPEPQDLPYNQFKQSVKEGKVASCQITPSLIRGQLKDMSKQNKPVYFRTARVDDPDLVKDLLAANVKFSGEYENLWKSFLVREDRGQTLIFLTFCGIGE